MEEAIKEYSAALAENISLSNQETTIKHECIKARDRLNRAKDALCDLELDALEVINHNAI